MFGIGNHSTENLDALGAKVGQAMTATGSGAAVVFGLTLNEWGVVVGIATAILGLGMNFWFKWREDQRQEDYYQKMRQR